MRKIIYLSFIIVFLFGNSCNKDNYIKLQPGLSDGNDASTITLQPGPENGKDAFVEYYNNDYNNRNFGNYDEFSAISWTADMEPFIVRSLIDFNFDAIPQNVTIESAQLSLYASGDAGHGTGQDTLGGSNECYLQRIITPWEEQTVTWNTQPQTTKIDRVILHRSDSTMENYTRIDVTSLVRDIYNDRSGSFGFMLRLKHENSYRRMFFASSDATDQSIRPKLVIRYIPNNHHF